MVAGEGGRSTGVLLYCISAQHCVASTYVISYYEIYALRFDSRTRGHILGPTVIHVCTRYEGIHQSHVHHVRVIIPFVGKGNDLYLQRLTVTIAPDILTSPTNSIIKQNRIQHDIGVRYK